MHFRREVLFCRIRASSWFPSAGIMAASVSLRADSLDRTRAGGALSAFVMTTRIPTRPGVLSNVGVRLSLRVLLLLGILPGGFVI